MKKLLFFISILFLAVLPACANETFPPEAKLILDEVYTFLREKRDYQIQSAVKARNPRGTLTTNFLSAEEVWCVVTDTPTPMNRVRAILIYRSGSSWRAETFTDRNMFNSVGCDNYPST